MQDAGCSKLLHVTQTRMITMDASETKETRSADRSRFSKHIRNTSVGLRLVYGRVVAGRRVDLAMFQEPDEIWKVSDSRVPLLFSLFLRLVSSSSSLLHEFMHEYNVLYLPRLPWASAAVEIS